MQLLGSIADAENALAKAFSTYEGRAAERNARVTNLPGNKVAGLRYRPRPKLRSDAAEKGGGELPWARFCRVVRWAAGPPMDTPSDRLPTPGDRLQPPVQS